MFGIKKLAYQFGRAVGYTDPTALPQQVQARCQDCEGYRAALIEACEALLQIMQGNPAHTPAVNSTQQCECPPGTAPSEMFDKSLDNMKGFWYDEEVRTLIQIFW
ncbi:hypothetical protein COOONC_25054, partial [Cooperia oncophora]